MQPNAESERKWCKNDWQSRLRPPIRLDDFERCSTMVRSRRISEWLAGTLELCCRVSRLWVRVPCPPLRADLPHFSWCFRISASSFLLHLPLISQGWVIWLHHRIGRKPRLPLRGTPPRGGSSSMVNYGRICCESFRWQFSSRFIWSIITDRLACLKSPRSPNSGFTKV